MRTQDPMLPFSTLNRFGFMGSSRIESRISELGIEKRR